MGYNQMMILNLYLIVDLANCPEFVYDVGIEMSTGRRPKTMHSRKIGKYIVIVGCLNERPKGTV